MADPALSLPLADSTSGGCGCGCGCGHIEQRQPQAEPDLATASAGEASAATTRLFAVTGMTCGHCVYAVTEEVAKIPGVSEVSVDLVAGGTSTLAVTAALPVDAAAISDALDEAGDYQLVEA